jgi:hypothetical protein
MAGMTVAAVAIIPLAPVCGRPAATGTAGSQGRRRSPAALTSVVGLEGGDDTIDGGAGIHEARTGTSAGAVVELTRRWGP